VNERRDRVHSCTVTVAVLEKAPHESPHLKRDEDDYLIEWYSGSGAGGQHRNKTQNSVRVTHIPTGITKTAQTRSRANSLSLAMHALNEELDLAAGLSADKAINGTRRTQVGTGERSDKRRTIRFQDGNVLDHVTNKRMDVSLYMRGHMDRVW
jgi:peptide chain release factor 1